MQPDIGQQNLLSLYRSAKRNGCARAHNIDQLIGNFHINIDYYYF